MTPAQLATQVLNHAVNGQLPQAKQALDQAVAKADSDIAAAKEMTDNANEIKQLATAQGQIIAAKIK